MTRTKQVPPAATATGSHFTSTQNGVVNTTGFIGVGRDENGGKIKFHITSTFVVSSDEVRVDNFEVTCG